MPSWSRSWWLRPAVPVWLAFSSKLRDMCLAKFPGLVDFAAQRRICGKANTGGGRSLRCGHPARVAVSCLRRRDSVPRSDPKGRAAPGPSPSSVRPSVLAIPHPRRALSARTGGLDADILEFGNGTSELGATKIDLSRHTVKSGAGRGCPSRRRTMPSRERSHRPPRLAGSRPRSAPKGQLLLIAGCYVIFNVVRPRARGAQGPKGLASPPGLHVSGGVYLLPRPSEAQ